jgi:Homeobox KN domain
VSWKLSLQEQNLSVNVNPFLFQFPRSSLGLFTASEMPYRLENSTKSRLQVRGLQATAAPSGSWLSTATVVVARLMFAAVALDDEAITYLQETAKVDKKGSSQSRRLQPWQIMGLKTWLNNHFDNPYPLPHEKQALCDEFKLTKQQVVFCFNLTLTGTACPAC